MCNRSSVPIAVEGKKLKNKWKREHQSFCNYASSTVEVRPFIFNETEKCKTTCDVLIYVKLIEICSTRDTTSSWIYVIFQEKIFK